MVVDVHLGVNLRTTPIYSGCTLVSGVFTTPPLQTATTSPGGGRGGVTPPEKQLAWKSTRRSWSHWRVWPRPGWRRRPGRPGWEPDRVWIRPGWRQLGYLRDGSGWEQCYPPDGYWCRKFGTSLAPANPFVVSQLVWSYCSWLVYCWTAKLPNYSLASSMF